MRAGVAAVLIVLAGCGSSIRGEQNWPNKLRVTGRAPGGLEPQRSRMRAELDAQRKIRDELRKLELEDGRSIGQLVDEKPELAAKLKELIDSLAPVSTGQDPIDDSAWIDLEVNIAQVKAIIRPYKE